MHLLRRHESGAWYHHGQLLEHDRQDGDNAGIALAIDHGRVLVGDNYDDTACPEPTTGGCNAGAAYLFKVD